MPNHFHLVVRPEGDNDLAAWMHWLLTLLQQSVPLPGSNPLILLQLMIDGSSNVLPGAIVTQPNDRLAIANGNSRPT